MGFFAVLAASLFAVFLFTVFGGYSLLLWCQQSLWMVVPPALVLAVLVWTFLKMDDKITALQKRVDELEAAFRQHPKALILCNPSNPCGKVFTRAELELIADMAEKYDTYVITDEVYEHIVYAPYQHNGWKRENVYWRDGTREETFKGRWKSRN